MSLPNLSVFTIFLFVTGKKYERETLLQKFSLFTVCLERIYLGYLEGEFQQDTGKMLKARVIGQENSVQNLASRNF